VYVLEAPGLLAFAVHGDVLVLEGLDDEVRNDAAVIRVHPWSKRVEDAGNSNIDLVLVPVRVHHRLGDALALVVARPRTDRVDVAPVALALRMLFWVAVNFAENGTRGEKEPVSDSSSRFVRYS